MTADTPRPHSLATASGLLLGAVLFASLIGLLIGWVIDATGIGLLFGVVLGIPLGIVLVYRVYSGSEQ